MHSWDVGLDSFICSLFIQKIFADFFLLIFYDIFYDSIAAKIFADILCATYYTNSE